MATPEDQTPEHPALEAMIARPRLAGLAAAPDGSLLVTAVATPAPAGTRYRTALWGLDPSGTTDPRRLTRSAAGEAGAAFLAGGDLLFTSARPDPDDKDAGEDPPAGLWRLPRSGGEARLLFAPGGGVAGVEVAREVDLAVVAAAIHPGAATLEEDRDRQKAREEAGVSARLYDRGTYPVRFWDHWLGPREPALWVLDTDALDGDGIDAGPEDAPSSARLLARGAALRDADLALSPDGTTLVTTWARTAPRTSPADLATDLVVIDVATGERRVLIADGRSYGAPAFAPGGRRLVACAQDLGSPERITDTTLVLIDLDSGAVRDLTPDLDRWPRAPHWTPDGAGVVFGADDTGHAPLFHVAIDSGEVRRLTGDGAYSDACQADDGALFALRSTVVAAPRPVRLSTSDEDQEPTLLDALSGPDPEVGALERVVTTTEDGGAVGSWLLTPTAAGSQAPAPLLVLIHGGPLGSWNGWHWRWNPGVLASAGYAVLLPDPALSTGYGQAWIERGWGRWGDAPYTDVMAATEDVAGRQEIDADRVAAAGGSFGGYLANWIAGQTDRFDAIVTHASLWSLPGFHGTTDLGLFWEREFGDPYLDDRRYVDNSPHRHVARITTPMLVIHGEQDLRVPISEGLTLWTDLVRHDVDARLLSFPDENHWILKPQHARLWYATVLAFLAEHLDGAPFARPELL